MRKTPVLAAMTAQRAATISRLAVLGGAEWERTCLPPWTVHDVVAHLVSIDEAAVSGRLLPVLLRAPDRPAIERWNDVAVLAYRDRTPGELIAALARWGRRLQRLTRLVPTVLGQARVSGPFGRQPLMYLLYRRVLDEWVHEHDIAAATATGAPGGDADAEVLPALPRQVVGEALSSAVLASLPQLVLPAVDRSVGVLRLTVDRAPFRADGTPADGGVAVHRMWGVDFARRQYGPRVLTRPDVEVRTSAPVLALLAEGRSDWRRLPGTLLTVEGDTDLAAAFLDAVAPGAAFRG
jgi:uncharacterized protein (TIGR03083 family)